MNSHCSCFPTNSYLRLHLPHFPEPLFARALLVAGQGSLERVCYHLCDIDRVLYSVHESNHLIFNAYIAGNPLKGLPPMFVLHVRRHMLLLQILNDVVILKGKQAFVKSFSK